MPRLIKYNANAKDNAKAFYSFSLPQSWNLPMQALLKSGIN
jgi:hypothetical protein